MFITILRPNFQPRNFNDTFINSMKLPIFLRFKEAIYFPVETAPCNVDHHANDKSVALNIKQKSLAREYHSLDLLSAENII